jgi:hypothetical protein
MSAKTQTERVRRYLLEHPGSSTWEMGMDLHLANVTARISDLRDLGVAVIKWRDDKGVFRYRIAEVTTGETVPMFAEAS